MNLKKKSIILFIFSAVVFAPAAVSFAQGEGTADQTGMLEIIAPETMIIHEPVPFDFPTNFVPSQDPVKTYALLDPANPDDILQIFDSNDGSGFFVTVSMTDMNSTSGSGNVIHYTNVGLVTIAQSPDGVDPGSFNRPPGTPNVIAPLKCQWDQWHGTIQDQCDNSMSNFPEPASPTTVTQNDLSPGDPDVQVQDTMAFNLPAPGTTAQAAIDNDVFTYSGITGNRLTGLSGVHAAHASGSSIKQYWNTSDQMTLLEDANTLDTGSYSVGFGFRLNITPEMKQDYYSGTVLFTLITI